MRYSYDNGNGFDKNLTLTHEFPATWLMARHAFGRRVTAEPLNN